MVSIMQVIGTSLSAANVAILIAVFFRLGSLSSRIKGVEWRLMQLEERKYVHIGR